MSPEAARPYADDASTDHKFQNFSISDVSMADDMNLLGAWDRGHSFNR